MLPHLKISDSTKVPTSKTYKGMPNSTWKQTCPIILHDKILKDKSEFRDLKMEKKKSVF